MSGPAEELCREMFVWRRPMPTRAETALVEEEAPEFDLIVVVVVVGEACCLLRMSVTGLRMLSVWHCKLNCVVGKASTLEARRVVAFSHKAKLEADC